MSCSPISPTVWGCLTDSYYQGGVLYVVRVCISSRITNNLQLVTSALNPEIYSYQQKILTIKSNKKKVKVRLFFVKMGWHITLMNKPLCLNLCNIVLIVAPLLRKSSDHNLIQTLND